MTEREDVKRIELEIVSTTRGAHDRDICGVLTMTRHEIHLSRSEPEFAEQVGIGKSVNLYYLGSLLVPLLPVPLEVLLYHVHFF